MREGRISIDEQGHEIYYRLHGKSSVTLIGLHGGPGVDHRYLTRLSELAGPDLQVLLYDQLGSGQSDRPGDDSLWAVARFVDELETIRTRLNLGPVHIFGQSWGGILALQYALDNPDAVKSLVLSNTGASVPHVFAEMTRLRSELDPQTFAALVRHEAAQNYDSPEYEAAVNELYARHLRRATPFELQRSLEELREQVLPLLDDLGPAYNAMWGLHEFLCVGPLLDWDVTERLSEITVPSLILCGYYDEATIPVHRVLAAGIPDNEFVIFGNSSHLTILEKEGDAYLGVIRHFVERVELRGTTIDIIE